MTLILSQYSITHFVNTDPGPDDVLQVTDIKHVLLLLIQFGHWYLLSKTEVDLLLLLLHSAMLVHYMMLSSVRLSVSLSVHRKPVLHKNF